MTVVVLAAVGISACVATMVWSKRPTAPTSAETQKRLEAGNIARSVLLGEPLVSLSEAGAVDRLTEAITGLVSSEWEFAAPGLGASVSKFLVSRYGGSDHAGYVAAMKRSGYAQRSLEDLKSRWFIDEAYQAYFGEPLPSLITWDDLAGKMFGAQDSYKRGQSRLSKVGSRGAGVEVVVKRLTRSDPKWPRLDGAIGDALDAGSVSISSSWWRSPSEYSQAISQGREPVVAAVGFCAEMRDGNRLPVAVSMFFDETNKKWWVVALWHGHLSPEAKSVLRFEF